jgi:hypothetical protein
MLYAHEYHELWCVFYGSIYAWYTEYTYYLRMIPIIYAWHMITLPIYVYEFHELWCVFCGSIYAWYTEYMHVLRMTILFTHDMLIYVWHHMQTGIRMILIIHNCRCWERFMGFGCGIIYAWYSGFMHDNSIYAWYAYLRQHTAPGPIYSAWLRQPALPCSAK